MVQGQLADTVPYLPAHVCCQRSKSPLPASTPCQFSPMPFCCGPRLQTHQSYLSALSVCTPALLQVMVGLPQASKLYMSLSSEFVHSSISAGGGPAAKAAVACCASTAPQSSTQAVTSCPCRMKVLPPHIRNLAVLLQILGELPEQPLLLQEIEWASKDLGDTLKFKDPKTVVSCPCGAQLQ